MMLLLKHLRLRVEGGMDTVIASDWSINMSVRLHTRLGGLGLLINKLLLVLILRIEMRSRVRGRVLVILLRQLGHPLMFLDQNLSLIWKIWLRGTS
jgi:hypothetical protein